MLAGAAGADNEWSRCGPGFRLPERPPSEAAGSDADPETVHLSADDADWVEDGVSRLVGSVAVEQGARLLRSDELTYHRPEEVIEARGRVRLWDEGLFVAGDRARTELGRDITTIEPATTFMLEDKHGHGDAAKARAFGNERLTADDATYTTCNPGDVDWRITARHVEFDHVEDVGTARNAWLEFKGHRVLYTPWVSFPLSDRRKSGFLTPIYGIGGRRGAELAIPYYFNLAPNYDATPHRGGRWASEGPRRRESSAFSPGYISGPAGSRRNTCRPTRNPATIARRSIFRTGTGGRTGGRRTPASNGPRMRSTSRISGRGSRRPAGAISHAGSMRATVATGGRDASGSWTS